MKTKRIKEFELKITVPFASFDSKGVDVKGVRERFVNMFMPLIIRDDVLIDDDHVKVELIGGK